jgi:hypothetical protein
MTTVWANDVSLVANPPHQRDAKKPVIADQF